MLCLVYVSCVCRVRVYVCVSVSMCVYLACVCVLPWNIQVYIAISRKSHKLVDVISKHSLSVRLCLHSQ